MTVTTVTTSPIDGQKPGTSGLRKKTRVFMQRHFLENFVQSIIDAIGGVEGKTLVLGGDGRFFNDRAAQVILRICAANGAAKVIVGRDALLSTPAASNLIGRLRMAASSCRQAIIPWRERGFRTKFNGANGGPAPDR